mgnify:CR=1 FL=1
MVTEQDMAFQCTTDLKTKTDIYSDVYWYIFVLMSIYIYFMDLF